MTYREAIQQIVEQLDAIYDKAGWLRDEATGDEKKYWNNLRGTTMEARNNMNTLDNELSPARAVDKVGV